MLGIRCVSYYSLYGWSMMIQLHYPNFAVAPVEWFRATVNPCLGGDMIDWVRNSQHDLCRFIVEAIQFVPKICAGTRNIPNPCNNTSRRHRLHLDLPIPTGTTGPVWPCPGASPAGSETAPPTWRTWSGFPVPKPGRLGGPNLRRFSKTPVKDSPVFTAILDLATFLTSITKQIGHSLVFELGMAHNSILNHFEMRLYTWKFWPISRGSSKLWLDNVLSLRRSPGLTLQPAFKKRQFFPRISDRL